MDDDGMESSYISASGPSIVLGQLDYTVTLLN